MKNAENKAVLSERGVLFIETAMLLPVAFATLFGVAFYGHLYVTKTRLGDSARVIARAIQDDPGISQGFRGTEAGELDQVVLAATGVEELPAGFNPSTYASCNGISKAKAIDQFVRFGRYENRLGTAGAACGEPTVVGAREPRVSIKAYRKKPSAAEVASQFPSHPSGRETGESGGWRIDNPNSNPTEPYWVAVVAKKPVRPVSLFGFSFGAAPEITNSAVVRVVPRSDCVPAGTLCGAGLLENSTYGVTIRGNESGVRTCQGTTLIDERSRQALASTVNGGLAHAGTTPDVVNCPAGYHGVLVGYAKRFDRGIAVEYFHYSCASDGLGCSVPGDEITPTPIPPTTTPLSPTPTVVGTATPRPSPVGTATPSVGGFKCVDGKLFQGTSKGDVLIGTDCDDIIIGGKGDDTLKGGKGDDTIKGGKGDDTIKGGKGDDTVKGGKGDDTINGGKGDDTIKGGKGDDAVKGGKGDDKINGGKGDDTIKGGKGDDTVKGGKGDDKIIGGEGGETILTGKGEDTVKLDLKKGDKVIVDGSVIKETKGGDIKVDGEKVSGDKIEVNGDTIQFEDAKKKADEDAKKKAEEDAKKKAEPAPTPKKKK